MSDVSLLQSFVDLERRVDRLETIEKPAVAMPFLQETVTPYTVSPTTVGYFLQYAPILLHRVRTAFFVNGANSGANYWTFSYREDAGGTTVYTFNTSTYAGVQWNLDNSAPSAQPPAANIVCRLTVTKTGAPGPLYCVPALYALFQT
jgi:hypothetical protein